MAKKETTVKKVLLAISVGVLLPLMAWGISSKISELTALTSLAGNDLFVVVDTSETETKKIARSDLVGIADNDLVEIDDANAADNDYAKFTADGLEGRSYAEVLADLSREDSDINALIVATKIDDLAAGDDNTDLNASISAHGLLKKLDNNASNFMDGQGNWSVPAGAGIATGYGVRWDEDLSSPTLIRTGTLAAFATGSSPGNSNLPVQASMRRVILNDAGVRQYYLCSTDSTKKENCSDASVLDGTDGQVMVEIRKFFYRYTYDSFDNVLDWAIAYTLLVGFEPHPAFYKDGAWVDYRYIGAYEGVGWDASAGAYIDNGNVAATGWSGTTIDTANDKLSSVSGKNPVTDEIRDEFRSIALNRGSGWRQQDFYLISAIQLLYLIEYASFDSQTTIGMGRTELTGGTWVNGSYISEGGLSNGDGNGTNSVTYSGDADDVGAEAAYMTYRGIENFFGNIGAFVDGFNTNNNIPYVSNTESDFTDDTTTNYTQLEDTGGSGITLYNTNDYQTTLEQIKGGFLPAAGGGSSSTYITDYYRQSTAWRTAVQSANAIDAFTSGVFYWDIGGVSNRDVSDIGSRLAY